MRQLVCTMFVSNNRASFPLQWKENLVNHEKVSKYYENDCRILFSSLLVFYIGKCSLIRHFSHVTKSRIFKNLNLREKADRNFRRTFLKNRFRHLKLYSNSPSWLARSCCHMDTFWKTKDFGMWNITHKEDLNRWKQVFLLNFRPWPAQKPKIWSIFYGKKFI